MMRAFLVFLLSIFSIFNFTSCLWPKELLKTTPVQFYDCLHAFFFCTDHVSYWPQNEKYCREVFSVCEKTIPFPLDGRYKDVTTTSGITSGTSTMPTPTTTTTAVTPSSTQTSTGSSTSATYITPTTSTSTKSSTSSESPPFSTVISTTSCSDLSEDGSSGLYTILIGGNSKEVYCDMRNYGGGWTVIQRRGDFGNDENYFSRNQTEYKNGFGEPKKEFWIGLEAMHLLTTTYAMDLLITLEDFEGDALEVVIEGFTIGNESTKYAISYNDAYYTTIENPGYLDVPPNGTPFSTESLESCPVGYSGNGWWLDTCFQSNPNGLNLRTQEAAVATGIIWVPWHGSYYSLKSTEIKMKKQNQEV